MKSFLVLLALLLGAPFLVSGAPSAEALEKLPAAKSGKVDFAREIKPLLENSCVKCHGKGKAKGGLNLDTREALLKGGDSGPSVLPGNSRESFLIHLVAGLDPENIMPEKGTKLTPEQVGTLRAWIDQGLPWDPHISFAKKDPENLKPAQVDFSKFPAKANPIDVALKSYFAANRIRLGKPVSDLLFARRVHLDIIGLLPTAEVIDSFLRDKNPNKREKLVDQLLSQNDAYAAHWLTFWNDLLRNDYRGAGYIDGGRKQISPWLYSALATNMAFNQFVSELVNPTPASEGFTKGIVWRGVVNASQTPQMQAAQNVSQVFMGVNLKCASCHDSFISDWTLADAYGLAGIYADAPLEMVECDKPLGKIAQTRFLYPELGTIPKEAPKAERLKQLSDLMTARENGRMPRTVVNRIWQRFFGYGLVEPVDEMENPSWHPPLLNVLAEHLVANGYDLKQTLRLMVTSQAYQLPSVDLGETVEKYLFRGPAIRRMSAEQFTDSLSQLTETWNVLPAADFDFRAGRPAGAWSKELASALKPSWIWTESAGATSVPAKKAYFQKAVVLPHAPAQAAILVHADDKFRLFINGKEIPPNNEFPWFDKTSLTDVRAFFTSGTNLVAVEVQNSTPSPAGLLVYGRIRGDQRGETIFDIATGSDWLASEQPGGKWQEREGSAAQWKPAAVLGDYTTAPWNIGNKWETSLATAQQYGRIRASMVPANPLMTAMGRPNREQLVTVRFSAATTLQGLEMTNGSTLAERLRQGSTYLAQQITSPGSFVERLYKASLNRAPTRKEREVALELIGDKVEAEDAEDLLWAITMLPEYQLIY